MSVPLINDDDLESGKDDIENDFAYRNNVQEASVKIRLAFLKKVYTLLSIQLLTTTLFGFVLLYWPSGKLFVQKNDWMILLAFILSLLTLVALHFKRREYPINFFLLAGFTVVQAYAVGVVVTYFDKVLVLQALLLTVSVVAGLTAYTFQTKRDFSSLGLVLFPLLCVLLIGGIVQLFFQNSIFELVLSISGAFIFCLFIIYDTQNIMKRVSPEEYILATIELYLDIVNLFLELLRILEAVRRG
ncbi:protein lifeguard 4-like [Cimex lectularius]|uniref:Uncharacterized protein n=1 Tax=Cimex lectularius TaxID=79782 RepID=A0A8I6SA35_CIMLE|nr:protein lifeguard 4-like [Cimex lectularius]